MFETYRMLGEQREAELLREAQRLHARPAVNEGRLLCAARRRLVSVFRGSTLVLLIRLRGSTTRATEKPARSQLDA